MKKKVLELDIGDLVVYPTYGVGEIENFDSYDIDGSKQDFILINFNNFIFITSYIFIESSRYRNAIAIYMYTHMSTYM